MKKPRIISGIQYSTTVIVEDGSGEEVKQYVIIAQDVENAIKKVRRLHPETIRIDACTAGGRSEFYY